MFSVIRKRLSYANVVATFAMVFAMSGGAYAASKYLITSTKQVKPSVLAQLKGKAGPSGATGTSGTAGPTGPTGPAGAGGAKGENGAPGANGTNGKTVLSGSGAPTSARGEAGDFYIRTSNDTVYGPKVGSNWGSATELKGKEGSPCTATCTLPSGKTETGVWSVPPVQSGEASYVPISFSIPLAAALPAGHAHFILPTGEEQFEFEATPIPSTKCHGSVNDPIAEPGNLCVYTSEPFEDVSVYSGSIKDPQLALGEGSAAKLGALLEVGLKFGSVPAAFGSWAVTAE